MHRIYRLLVLSGVMIAALTGVGTIRDIQNARMPQLFESGQQRPSL